MGGHDLGPDREGSGDHGGDEKRDDQGAQAAAFRQRADKAVGSGIAGVGHSNEDQDDEDYQRDDHIPDGGAGALRQFPFFGMGPDLRALRGQLSGQKGPILRALHGAVIPAGKGDDQNHGDGADGIILIRNAGQKVIGGISAVGDFLIKAADDPDDIGAPGGQREQRGHGGCGGVQNIGQLFMGDLQLVGDIPKDGPHQNGVGGVAEPDRHAAQPGGHLPAAPCLHHVFGQRVGKGLGAAAPLQHQRESAAKRAEADHPLVVHIHKSGQNILKEGVEQSGPWISEIQHGGADKNGDKQG